MPGGPGVVTVAAPCHASHWEEVAGEWVCRADDPDAATWCGCRAGDDPDPDRNARLRAEDAPEQCVGQRGRVTEDGGAVHVQLFGYCDSGTTTYTDQFGPGDVHPIPPLETHWLVSLRFDAALPRDVPIDLASLGPDQVSWEIQGPAENADWFGPGSCPGPFEDGNRRPGFHTCHSSQLERFTGPHRGLPGLQGTVVLSAGHISLDMPSLVCGLRSTPRGWTQRCAYHQEPWGVDHLVIDADLGPGGELRRSDVSGAEGVVGDWRHDLDDAVAIAALVGLPPLPRPGPDDPHVPPGPDGVFACGASHWAWGDGGWACLPDDPAAERWCGCAGDDTRPDVRETTPGCSAQPGRVEERPDGVYVELFGACADDDLVYTDPEGAGGPQPVPTGQTFWGLTFRFAPDVPRGVPVDLRSLRPDQFSWTLTHATKDAFDLDACSGNAVHPAWCDEPPPDPSATALVQFGGPSGLLGSPGGTVVLSPGHLTLDVPTWICGLRRRHEGADGDPWFQQCLTWYRGGRPGIRIDADLGPGGLIDASQLPVFGYSYGSQLQGPPAPDFILY